MRRWEIIGMMATIVIMLTIPASYVKSYYQKRTTARLSHTPPAVFVGREKCITCHKIPAEAPKGKKAKKKLSKKEKIKEYHAEALHANCKGCHKKFNKKFENLVDLFQQCVFR